MIEPKNKIKEVLAIYDSENIKEITKDEMKRYFANALNIVQTLATDETKKSFITVYFTNLMEREN